MITQTRPRIVELRRYTLVPGRRDVLIDLFDQVFVRAQEDLDIHVIGSFRDLSDDDAFVWLRAFPSPEARAAALSGFYYGPVWKQHRETANATMLDSDDVLLCEPLATFDAMPAIGGGRREEPSTSVVEALTLTVDEVADVTERAQSVLDALTAAGAEPVMVLAGGGLENGFPALPVRDDATVTWVTRFDSPERYEHYRSSLPLDMVLGTSFGEPRAGADRVRRLVLAPTRSSQLV